MASELARRSSIDGLRAVAVLSVIAFHMEAAWLPGGFIGVDVFFVISAYLITRIVDEQLRTRSFRFATFYARRVKRIFPMSALVFFVTAALATQTNVALLASAKFIPLLTYNQHAVGYFSSDAQKNYFLHFWSLAIEEQFYLIWPAAMAACAWAARRYQRVSQTGAIVALSLVVAATGMVYGVVLVREPATSGDAYFQSFPRFGEMAVGAAVALMERGWHARRALRDALSWLGSAGIVASSFFVSDAGYPGLLALAPTLSAAVLLVGCGDAPGRPGTIARLLSARPLVEVGRRSFSLYLWHWPVLAFARFVVGSNRLALPTLALCGGVTALLTYLSYRGVEKPVMNSTAPAARAFGGFLLGSASLLGLVVLFAGIQEYGIPPVLGREYANFTVDGQNAHLAEGWTAPCWDRHLASTSKREVDAACGIGAKSEQRVLLVGDSHAAALGTFIDLVAKREGFAVTSLQVGACQIAEWGLAARVPGFVRTRERSENCEQVRAFLLDNAHAYDAVFVVNAFNLFAGDFDVFKSVPSPRPTMDLGVLRKLASASPLFFFYDGPVIDRSIQYSPLLASLGVSIGATPVQGGTSGNAVVREVVSQVPNSRWIDLSREYERFVANRFFYEERPVYVDTSHLNGHGARVLAELFLARGGCLLCEPGKEHSASAR